MRALLQRVCEAEVTIDDRTVSRIDRGLLIFLGIQPDDSTAEIDWMVEKILGLRIFPDDDKPMNRSVMDTDGEVLVVSQFTLAADTSRGKRPGFSSAAAPGIAEPLYDQFLETMSSRWPKVVGGRFGANMKVALVNDGPVTFLLER